MHVCVCRGGHMQAHGLIAVHAGSCRPTLSFALRRYDGSPSRAMYGGQLAGLAVFDAALTMDDVAQLYDAVRCGRTAGRRTESDGC